MNESIDPNDFEVEKFFSADAKGDSEPIKYVVRACELILVDRLASGIIADPGSGVEFAFENFREKYRNQVVIIDCAGLDLNVIYGNLMLKLGFGHELVNWHTASYGEILEAIAYYLHETNFRPLFIFNNCDTFRIEPLKEFLDTIFKLKGKAGVLFRVSRKKAKSFINNTDSTLRSRVGRLEWIELTDPEPEVIRKYCIDSGILSERVLDDLLQDNPDFEVITIRLDKIRDALRTRLDKKKVIK